MTISSEVRKAGPFDGNDVADTFPFSFKVFTVADLMVVRADSLGVETVLTLGTDYTVSLNPNQNESPGGSVVTTSPLAAGFKLVLTSKVGNLQPVDLTNQGGFYPSVINGALDRLTIMAQQLRVDVDRSAKLPITREEDADELLADIVLIADNMANVNTVSGNIADIIEVSGISGDVTTVAGVAPSVPVVAAIDDEVATVAGVASDIPAVAASAANIDAVAADLANVNTVAANIGSVNATAPEIDSVVKVAEHMPDILAALADLPALAAKVSKTGDVMTGHLEVPAGATGAQAVRASEAQWSQPVEISTTSGTSIDITGMPTGVNEIYLDIAFGTTGSVGVNINLIDSGVVLSGYASSGAFVANASNTFVSDLSSAFQLSSPVDARFGEIRITRSRNDNWTIAGVVKGGLSHVDLLNGRVALSSGLTGIRFSPTSGSFSSGVIIVRYRY